MRKRKVVAIILPLISPLIHWGKLPLIHWGNLPLIHWGNLPLVHWG